MIPEREPEKRLPHLRVAAGAQITQFQNGEVVNKNNNSMLSGSSELLVWNVPIYSKLQLSKRNNHADLQNVNLHVKFSLETTNSLTAATLIYAPGAGVSTGGQVWCQQPR